MKYLLMIISILVLTACGSNLKTTEGIDSEKHKAIWISGYKFGVSTGCDEHKKFISESEGFVCYPKPKKLIGVAKL